MKTQISLPEHKQLRRGALGVVGRTILSSQNADDLLNVVVTARNDGRQPAQRGYVQSLISLFKNPLPTVATLLVPVSISKTHCANPYFSQVRNEEWGGLVCRT